MRRRYCDLPRGPEPDGRLMRVLSPISLVAICWGTTCLIAMLALALPKTFDLLPILMHREALTKAAFAPLGAAWLLLAAQIGRASCRERV